MPSGFSNAVARLDQAVMQTLGDGKGNLYDSKDQLVASEISYMFDKDFIDQNNFGERQQVITLNRRDLTKVDPNGSFESGSKRWQLKGVASDDGQLIAFKVV